MWLREVQNVSFSFSSIVSFQVKRLTTVKTAKWACLITTVVFGIFDAQFFIIMTAYKRHGVFNQCMWQYVPETYELNVNRFNAAVCSFIPFIFMIFANFAIIYKFMKARRKNQQGGTGSTSQALSKAATRGTAMLITVSTVFIITTAPTSIVWAITSQPDELLYAITSFLKYVNYSINGFLYTIVGSRFRSELILILTCGVRKLSPRNQSMTMSSSNITQRTASQSNLATTVSE